MSHRCGPEMSHPSNNTTRWRDSAVVPERYDDLPSLVKVARNARGRLASFGWGFSPVDLLGLRRAVYEWGSRYAGRYKSFDARVLAVINQALGDSSSVFVLNEPKNIPPPDAEVACTRVGDLFRLQGYAPFDIVFAYECWCWPKPAGGRVFEPCRPADAGLSD
jgi:hypothetical protein